MELRRGGGLHGQRSALGSEWFEPHIGLSSAGVQHQEDQVPLAGWRAGETNRKAVGSLDSAHEEHMHAWLLPKQGTDGELKLHRTLASFLQLPRHLGLI